MDKIAEMLTKIRNAQMAGHREVSVKFSKLKLSLAEILKKEGFLEAVYPKKDKSGILLVLKYHRVSHTESNPAIVGIKRVSRVGRRVYVKSKDINRVKNGYGLAVISTSRGMMTGEESQKAGLGGEYICQVW